MASWRDKGAMAGRELANSEAAGWHWKEAEAGLRPQAWASTAAKLDSSRLNPRRRYRQAEIARRG